MKKRLISILVVAVLCFVPSSTIGVFAATPNQTVSSDMNVATTESAENEVQPRTDGYYYWQCDSKTNVGTTSGPWEPGPQGAGPCTLSLAKEESVSNSITGSYTSVGAISSYLGVTINKTYTESVEYTLSVPEGKTYEIIYRPLYRKYKVVQNQYYRIDGYSTPTGNSKTCYVEVFYGWGFNYNILQ